MATQERLLEREEDLQNAIKRLHEVLVLPNNDIVRDATIQRFEFCYELAWKTLKLLLETKDIDVRNAKDTLQAALQQGFIEDGDHWSLLHEYRNLTSHTYDEALAQETYQFIHDSGIMLFDGLLKKLEQVRSK